MVLKEVVSKDKDIAKLEELLKYNLTKEQSSNIEKEIYMLKKGYSGEKNSAHYIDTYYKDSENWVIIHDLRLEINEEVVQIDHLLISRFFEFYLLETKNFNSKITINEHGEFSVSYGKNTFGIPSPIEQNNRHISLLKKVLDKYEKILPKRLGFTIQPKFFNYVLVAPKSIVNRPKGGFDSSMVIKADSFKSEIDKKFDNLGNTEALNCLFKVSSFSTIRKVGSQLVALNKPSKVDYIKKFQIKPEQMRSDKSYYCFKCKKSISFKVAKFCWDDKGRFNGKVYCYNCQKVFKRSSQKNSQLEMV